MRIDQNSAHATGDVNYPPPAGAGGTGFARASVCHNCLMIRPPSPGAEPSLEALETAVAGAHDIHERVDALLRLARALGNSDPPRALALSYDALRFAASVDYAEGIAWSHRRRAFLLNVTGKSLAALAEAREALARFRKLALPGGEAAALRDLGAICLSLGRLRAGLVYLQRALALCERTGDLRGAAVARLTMGQLHAQLDENGPALVDFAAALEAYRRLRDAAGEASARLNAGIAERHLGRAAAARAHYRAALAIARRRGYKRLEAEALIMCAELELDARRWSRAASAFERGAALAESLDASAPRLNAEYGLGMVALARDERAAAGRRFADLRARATACGSRYGIMLARLGEGHLALAEGRMGDARRRAREALELARDQENREYRDAARRLLAAVAAGEPR